jgi:hypothetical protein
VHIRGHSNNTFETLFLLLLEATKFAREKDNASKDTLQQTHLIFQSNFGLKISDEI